ncbi:hypothetical protein [Phyllobacterium phragmitis]|uniref:hypothetical protein n=1 Tax=Phyllobacterium phragmitis TaxID=2670329 RepID=UPI001304B164|nr:hypothetical protein [Phyllobacterium phragmitis]
MPTSYNPHQTEWLTARQVHEAQLLGMSRSYQAVRLYIQRHWLSAHPTLCRKAAGKGTTMEYHVSLFSQDAIARRKKRRGWRDWQPVRGMQILEIAENGELHREITLMIRIEHSLTFPTSKAAPIRAVCIAKFGKAVSLNAEGTQTAPMPSVRVFAAYIRWILQKQQTTLWLEKRWPHVR